MRCARGSLQPCQRRRDFRVDADRVVGIAAAFHEGPHRIGAFRLTQQDTMRPAAENLAELPGIVTHMRGIDAVHRRFHDHRRRAMARPCRPGIGHAAHVGGQARHVERAVLHADIHVIGPGAGIYGALCMGQHMAAVRAVVIDGLILLQQFDAAVDPLTHEGLP